MTQALSQKICGERAELYRLGRGAGGCTGWHIRRPSPVVHHHCLLPRRDGCAARIDAWAYAEADGRGIVQAFWQVPLHDVGGAVRLIERSDDARACRAATSGESTRNLRLPN